MSALLWLTPVNVERVKPYFLSHGISRVDDRRVLSGIVPVIRNGLCGAMRRMFRPCSEIEFWIAGGWSFPAVITVSGWSCHRDFITQSGHYNQSRWEDDPRCSIDATPPAFPAHLQGSEANERSGIRRGACC